MYMVYLLLYAVVQYKYLEQFKKMFEMIVLLFYYIYTICRYVMFSAFWAINTIYTSTNPASSSYKSIVCYEEEVPVSSE